MIDVIAEMCKKSSGLSNLFENLHGRLLDSSKKQLYVVERQVIYSHFWNQVVQIQQNENHFLQHIVLTHIHLAHKEQCT